MTASTLARRLAAGAFVVTAEVTPPLAASAEALLERAAPLEGLVDAVNVTDAAGARAAMSSFAAAAILARHGIEPVLQVTCRDRNRIALVGDLIGAAAQGVSNLLILHGDDPAAGDMPEAMPVHDLDSRGAIALARTMAGEGRLPSGRMIDPPPGFFIGAADTPVAAGAAWVPEGLLAKITAGAHFVQTQLCFDLEVARRYVAGLGRNGVTEQVSVILGTGPIASARSARWMNDKLYGVTVPEPVVERLERAHDPAAEGRAMCRELIAGLAEIDGVAGVHLMAPMQDAAAIAEIIRTSGLR